MNSLLGAIGKLCAESGATKKGIAKEIGITTTAFRRKCDGRAPWKLNEAAQMAEILGITLAEFYELANCEVAA